MLDHHLFRSSISFLAHDLFSSVYLLPAKSYKAWTNYAFFSYFLNLWITYIVLIIGPLPWYPAVLYSIIANLYLIFIIWASLNTPGASKIMTSMNLAILSQFKGD